MRAASSFYDQTGEYIIMVGVDRCSIALDPADIRERVRQEIARRLADEVMSRVKLTVEDLHETTGGPG
jgi:hypothetical protein